jgi:Ni/Fe-hydrogenase subunit HybB-like protein
MTTAVGLLRRRLPIGTLVLGGLVVLAFVLAMIRYAGGLGAASNLNDNYAWGLWISVDLLCGVALAAGAFTTATAVYIIGQERYRPILRPAILTGFLGYLMVIFALLVDLGRPERIWYLIIFWNPHSVMFEVGWCVMLYTAVLALEFSPMMFERFGLRQPLRLITRVTLALVIAGTVLSTLHQSSLGSLYLIIPDQLDVLWHTPLLPLFFFLSAVAAGPSMVILESSISSRVFKRGLEVDILGSFARAIPFVLALYLALKIADLGIAGELGDVFNGSRNSALFLTETVVGVILPMVLFALPAIRRNGTALFLTASLVVGGLILNRINVGILGFSRPADAASYVPSWMEFFITFGIVAAGVIAFGLVARYLPLFAQTDKAGEEGTAR